MKNQNVNIFILAAITIMPSVILARSFMPRIENLRNKIETISQNTPQSNIKELLESAKIERDANGTMHKIISFESSQTTDTGLLLEKEIKDIYWSNRSDLVEIIQTKKMASKAEQRALLLKELSQKYPNNNRAVIVFAGELSNEEIKLTDLTTRIFKATGDGKKTSAPIKLNELLFTVSKLKQNLQIITNFVNEILMG